MDRDSALLLNAGAHYIKTTSFQSYQQVIVALISEIKKLYHGKPIWKSTTAIHGQTADIMGAFRRFTTNHVCIRLDFIQVTYHWEPQFIRIIESIQRLPRPLQPQACLDDRY